MTRTKLCGVVRGGGVCSEIGLAACRPDNGCMVGGASVGHVTVVITSPLLW